MKTLISFKQTPIIKFVIPATLVLNLIIILPGYFEMIFSNPLFISIIIVNIPIIYYTCMRYKKVIIDGQNLLISNYIKEIKVHHTNILKLTHNSFFRDKPVTIHFKQKTQFGRKITFILSTKLSGKKFDENFQHYITTGEFIEE